MDPSYHSQSFYDGSFFDSVSTGRQHMQNDVLPNWEGNLLRANSFSTGSGSDRTRQEIARSLPLPVLNSDGNRNWFRPGCGWRVWGVSVFWLNPRDYSLFQSKELY